MLQKIALFVLLGSTTLDAIPKKNTRIEQLETERASQSSSADRLIKNVFTEGLLVVAVVWPKARLKRSTKPPVPSRRRRLNFD